MSWAENFTDAISEVASMTDEGQVAFADCVCDCASCRAYACHRCERSTFHAYMCRLT